MKNANKKHRELFLSLLCGFLGGLLLGFHRSFQFCQCRKVTKSGLLHLRHLYLRLLRFSAFLARLSRSLFCTSSPVRARNEDTLSVTTSLNHLERQFVANSTPPRAIKKEKKHHPNPNKKMGSSFYSIGVRTTHSLFIYMVLPFNKVFSPFTSGLVLTWSPRIACINSLGPFHFTRSFFIQAPSILSNKRFLVISTGTSSHFWSSTRLPMPHTTQ